MSFCVQFSFCFCFFEAWSHVFQADWPQACYIVEDWIYYPPECWEHWCDLPPLIYIFLGTEPRHSYILREHSTHRAVLLCWMYSFLHMKVVCMLFCVWPHVCVGVDVHICVRVCRGPRLTLGVFFIVTDLRYWEQVFLSSELAISVSLASQLVQGVPVSVSCTTGLQEGCNGSLAFYMGARDPKYRFRFFLPSDFPTEQSHQPPWPPTFYPHLDSSRSSVSFKFSSCKLSGI